MSPIDVDFPCKGGGKRWARRYENVTFTDNPHVVQPTANGDTSQPLQLPSSTFPDPLPFYLPRTVHLPPATPPPTIPSSSTAGLFSFSLRGVRRTLRVRPSAPHLVNAIESHLASWLQGGTYLNPDNTKGLLHFPGVPVGGREDIKEVRREAGILVWAVKPTPSNADGGFERYVVHCVARWYGIVSFSKETDGHRLTYLLRPNITRPVNPTCSLDTPPATDGDVNTTDGSDYNISDVSDIDSISGDLPRPLSGIEESRPSSPASWSVLGGSDFAIDSDNDTDDRGFAASMESLSLSTRDDDVAVPLATDTMRLQSTVVTTRAAFSADMERGESTTASPVRAHRDRLRTLYPRSASSPSPARRHRLPTPRKPKRKAKNDKKAKGSFYDYLFA